MKDKKLNHIFLEIGLLWTAIIFLFLESYGAAAGLFVLYKLAGQNFAQSRLREEAEGVG